MVISSDTQLGLRMRELEVQREFLFSLRRFQEDKLSKVRDAIKVREEGISYGMDLPPTEEEKMLITAPENEECKKRVTIGIGERNIIGNEDSLFFLITQGVNKPAEMIKMKNGFTGRILKDIKPGKYTYLMGKNEMVRFVVHDNFVKGFFWNDKEDKVVEFGCETDTGQFFCDNEFHKEFNRVIQIITFIELGDIETVILASNQNNGKPKKHGKITNSSHYTVYVVDSSWNQLIIRTDGFAVRGHFRLQPCGAAMADRKLIWIDAFEKHGYIRRPRAEIRD